LCILGKPIDLITKNVTPSKRIILFGASDFLDLAIMMPEIRYRKNGV
jgi:hypothetical protein